MAVGVRHLSKRLAGRLVLDDVSVDLADGVVAVVGDSGSGKSTFLHVVAGVKCPDGGEIRVGDVEVAALDVAGRRRFLTDRVAAVMAVVGDSPGLPPAESCCLVVADDPTAWLTLSERKATAALLESLRAPGRVVLVATHDPELQAVADQIVELAGGRLIA